MSFEAKRLRVQLPCGENTAVEEIEAGFIPPWCDICTETCRDTCERTFICAATYRCGESCQISVIAAQYDAEDLASLREGLQAKLAEVEKAQAAVQRHKGK